MKKILFVTIHLPYPPNKGASVFNTFKLVEYLHQHHDLHVVSLLKNDDPQYATDFVNHLSLKQYTFERVDIPRSPANLVKSYLRNVSLNVYRSYSSALREKIYRLAGDYDIIFIDHYEAFQYVPDYFTGKVILRIHNAEYMIWKRYAKLQQNFLKKWLLSLEAWRIKRLEELYCKRADTILGPVEDNLHLEANPEVRQKKFVNFTFLGDDSQLDLPISGFDDLENSLLYVGTLTWEPNVDGLVWFINECWEKIKHMVPKVRLYIVGKNPDPRLIKISEKYPDIILAGFVEDLEEYFMKCKVNIVPLRFGSGVKVKVINGLCRGVPVVTTPIGIESIEVIPDKHILVAKNAQEFIDRTIKLLKDQHTWTHISKHARLVAQEKFTWKAIYNKLDQVLLYL